MLSMLVAIVLHTSVITEDDPRWDCHTMGNRVCGTQAQIDQRASEAAHDA